MENDHYATFPHMEKSNEIAERILSQCARLPIKLERKKQLLTPKSSSQDPDRRIASIIQRSDFKVYVSHCLLAIITNSFFEEMKPEGTS
jgi:hypothetical protein